MVILGAPRLLESFGLRLYANPQKSPTFPKIVSLGSNNGVRTPLIGITQRCDYCWTSDDGRIMIFSEKRRSNMPTAPPFEIDGQVFETVADLSRYSGIHYATLQYRLKKGLSVEEATKQSDFQKNRKKTPSKTYEFNGKTYRSIKSLSDATGVPYATLRWRLRQGQAVETAVCSVMEMVRSWEVLASFTEFVCSCEGIR